MTAGLSWRKRGRRMIQKPSKRFRPWLERVTTRSPLGHQELEPMLWLDFSVETTALSHAAEIAELAVVRREAQA